MAPGILRVGTIVAALAAPMLIAAPARADEREVVYPKHTIMRFADETVDGNLATPDGHWVLAQPGRVGPKLIRIRTTFRREILASLRR